MSEKLFHLIHIFFEIANFVYIRRKNPLPDEEKPP